jgi:hypothetical protein
MLDALLGPLWPYMAGAGAALAAWAAYALRIRRASREGAQRAAEAMQQKDRGRAREIENAADAARLGGGDAVDGLRRAGRLRDD